MTRVKAVVLEGPADAATIAAIRAELDAQADTIVVASPSVREIVERVGYEMGVPVRTIVSDQRHVPAVRARTAACWLAWRLTGKGLAQIGRILGGRDHSTILASIRRANELRHRDPAFRQLTDHLLHEFEEIAG